MLIRRDRAMMAVTIMLDVAFHGGRTATVSAADLAERLGLARRAGLLDSVRGPRGGYRLGRPRRDIRLSEIVEVAVAAGASEASDGADGPIGALQSDVVDPLWNEIDAAARAQLGALTLDDLLKRAAAAGLRRPSAEPISFAI